MDPITIAAAASAIASLFSGVSSFLGSKGAARAEEAAARQSSREAGVEANMALAQGDAVAASAATQVAANGGGLGGSSLAVIDQLSSQAMFNARRAIYGGVTEANAHLYNAKVAKKNGKLALIGSVFGAAGQGLAAGASASNSQAAATMLSRTSGGADPATPDLAGLY